MNQYRLANVTQLIHGRDIFEPICLTPKLTFFPQSQYVVIMTGTVPILPMKNKICANKTAVRGDYMFYIISK